MRHKFMYRKGVSGDWRGRFDEQLADEFRRRFGDLMERWGYSWEDAGHPPTDLIPRSGSLSSNERASEFQLVSAPFPCGVAWLVNVLLELGIRTTHRGPAYEGQHWVRDETTGKT